MGGAVSAGRDNNELIDNLVGGSYIRTQTVERVFRALDRADYMIPEERDQAYKDLAWRHGYLHLSAPCIYSEVMEGLDLKPGLSFLNIGSGTGYLSTLAGLILGSSGISHGVEENVSVVEYANKKLSQFMDISVALDEFDFCEPKFYCGNGLRLAPLETPYDRVYCGAGCPEEYISYFKQLIKVGGVLVMPLNENLLQIRRVGPAQWSTRSLLSVSFAALRVPQENTEFVKLDTLRPARLQQLCRGVVRGAMLRGLLRRHPELRAPPAPPPAAPHAPAKRACRPKRICIPIENEEDVEGLDALHDLDRADRGSGAHEMNALLSLVLSMGHNRVAGALRFDEPADDDDDDDDDEDEDGDGGDGGDGGDSGDELEHEASDAAADDADVGHAAGDPMEERVNQALQQALDGHRVLNDYREARRRAALRSSILMFDLAPRGRSGSDTDADTDADADADTDTNANTSRADATPEAAGGGGGGEGGGAEPTAGTSRDPGAGADRPRRGRGARPARSPPYVPSEVEICLGKMRDAVAAPSPTTTTTTTTTAAAAADTSRPATEPPATADMEWEGDAPEEDSDEEARIEGGARWAAGGRGKRLKLDSGIGEITPSSHSSPVSGGSKAEGSDGSGGSGSPAADTPPAPAPAPASDASGRRRRYMRHLGSWSSSSEGSDGSQGAAAGSRRRRHKRRAGAGAGAGGSGSGSASGGGRGRGGDARRVRLSLRMKQAVKELPLPHALKKYVNLGRCYQF